MQKTTDTRPVALVTGATSGFGLATAVRLQACGYRTFGTSRGRIAEPREVELLELDVDSDDSVKNCVDELLRRAGRLDLLVNNAGRAMVGACEETSATEARALFETNVFGVMRMVSAVLPTMRAQRTGAIVNIGSASGFVGIPFHGVYSASKYALAGYTEALRLEVRPFGIRVSVIEPAAHRTGIPMIRPLQLATHYGVGRDRVEAIIRKQINQGASPERVVDAIVAAATSPSPRLRYRVGGKAMLAAVARRLLPSRLFERFLRYEFRLPSGTT